MPCRSPLAPGSCSLAVQALLQVCSEPQPLVLRELIHHGQEKPDGLCSPLAQTPHRESALLWPEQPGKRCFSRISFQQTENPTDFFLARTEAFVQ